MRHGFSPRSSSSLRAATLALALIGCNSSSPAPAPSDGGSTPPPTRWAAAVGALGTFTQTFDEVSWTSRALVPGDLYAVTCVGNLEGWTAGAAGTIAHTTDGGARWTAQSSPAGAALRAIRFASTSDGVVAGDGGVLGVTHDGGNTWTLVPGLTPATLRGAAVARTVGLTIVVGDGGTVLRSADGGASWTASTIAGAGDLVGVATDTVGARVLAVDASGRIWASVDTGVHFAIAALAPAALGAVATSDDGALSVAVGAHGLVLVSSAGGPWETVRAGTGANLHAVVVTGFDDDLVYAGGESGTLVRSDDRGTTWTPQPSGTTAALYGLDDL